MYRPTRVFRLEAIKLMSENPCHWPEAALHLIRDQDTPNGPSITSRPPQPRLLRVTEPIPIEAATRANPWTGADAGWSWALANSRRQRCRRCFYSFEPSRPTCSHQRLRTARRRVLQTEGREPAAKPITRKHAYTQITVHTVQ